MNWRYFVGAAILSSGLLFKAGAPVEAVVLGIALVALMNWRSLRNSQ
jgi:hypothetical protein